MPGIVRLTDVWTGQCCCHVDPPCIPMNGIVISCSPSVFCNGLGEARITDLVVGSCGHIGRIISGSGVSFANGLGKARLGDIVTGCTIGKLVTCSPNTFTT